MVLEAVSRVEQDVVVRCINTEPGVGEHKYNNLLMRGQGEGSSTRGERYNTVGYTGRESS
jgi:hypothetical protein